jgi:hypothetical protein
MSSSDLYKMPRGVQTRWSSPENPEGCVSAGGQANAGRKGRQAVTLRAGESITLAQVSGQSGIVHRMWATIDDRHFKMLRGLRIECYWDGAEKPAVSAPMGDFFGTGLGRMVAFESAFFSNPEGRSFNCRVPMPFRTGMKITVTNESDRDLAQLYYEVNYTLGDQLEETALYFHAFWRRENPTLLQRDFEILPYVAGQGRFLGCNIGVIADRAQYGLTWWGEGEVKIYLDGDTALPTLCGTGTEDYIGTAWGQGRYDHLYQGCHLADADKMQYCFYRYHGPDPVWFYRDIRVTIQQIGCWSPETRWQMTQKGVDFKMAGAGPASIDWAKDLRPYGLFERSDDWSSCAYFYLRAPMNGLPPLAAVDERIAALS